MNLSERYTVTMMHKMEKETHKRSLAVWHFSCIGMCPGAKAIYSFQTCFFLLHTKMVMHMRKQCAVGDDVVAVVGTAGAGAGSVVVIQTLFQLIESSCKILYAWNALTHICAHFSSAQTFNGVPTKCIISRCLTSSVTSMQIQQFYDQISRENCRKTNYLKLLVKIPMSCLPFT